MPANAATLDTILGTPAYYRQLYAYAEGEWNTENLDFLTAAAMYRRNPSKQRALDIIDRFVKENAAKQVNISFSQRGGVLAATSGYAASRASAQGMGFFKRHWTAGHRKAAENVFDEAIHEVRLLVISDTLSRFLATDEGRAIEAAIQYRATRAAGTRAALLDMGLS